MSEIQVYTEAVRVIKEAILQSQYRAVSIANKEQLSLYYGIGKSLFLLIFEISLINSIARECCFDLCFLINRFVSYK